VIKTKNFPFGLNPNAETLLASVTIFLPSEYLVSVNNPAEPVTAARGEEETRPCTRGISNVPVLAQPHVGGKEKLLAITIDRSTDFITPSALVPVIVRSNVPGAGDAGVETVKVTEIPPVDGTVRLVGARVSATPAGAVPLQAALSCTISLAPLADRRMICEVFVDEAIIARDRGEPETMKSKLSAITIDKFTDFVTPLELLPVIVKVNVPNDGDAEVKIVRVAETRPVDGTVRLVGLSVNVTPAGTAPLQAAFSSTMSLTPLTDRKVICEVFVEEASSDRDGAEAEAWKSKLFDLEAGHVARNTSQLWSAFWPETWSALLTKAIFAPSALVDGTWL